MGLVDKIKELFKPSERSSVQEYMLRTGKAYIDPDTAQQVKAIVNDETRQDFGYFLQQYKTSIKDMTHRQEKFTRSALEMLIYYLPAFMGSVGVDNITGPDAPTMSAYVGVGVGVKGLVVLHHYSGFRRSVGKSEAAATKLTDYIKEHHDELLETEDEGIKAIVDNGEALVVAGNSNDKYHQLQDYDSLLRYTSRNKDKINGNTAEIAILQRITNETSRRVKEMESRPEITPINIDLPDPASAAYPPVRDGDTEPLDLNWVNEWGYPGMLDKTETPPTFPRLLDTEDTLDLPKPYVDGGLRSNNNEPLAPGC